MVTSSGIVVIVVLWLVGGDWNMTFIFPYIGNVIIPIDELIFFRGVGQPPTRWFLMFKTYQSASTSWLWIICQNLGELAVVPGSGYVHSVMGLDRDQAVPFQ